MTQHSHRLVVLAICTAALMPAAAQAQWYGAPPWTPPARHNPYAVPAGQPYAVEVAPGKYVIHRPSRHRVSRQRARRHVAYSRRHDVRRHTSRPSERAIIGTTKVVRDKFAVRETRRVAGNPSPVIDRRHKTENVPVSGRHKVSSARSSIFTPGRGSHNPRVIHADAEVTILGPDRMSIRLIRKRAAGVHAEAKAKRSPKQ